MPLPLPESRQEQKNNRAMKRNYEAPLVKVVDIQPEGLLMASNVSITDEPASGDYGVDVKGESGFGSNGGGKSIWDDQW